MYNIPKSWKDIFEAIIRGPVAWQALTDLAKAIGSDLDVTSDLLAELETSGWIEVWEQSDVLAVTLSPLGSARLGVRLIEVGPEELPRWGFVGDPEPPAPRAKGVAREARAAELLSVVDTSPGPVLAAEIAELAATATQRAPGSVHFPRPTLLIGQGLSPWPGPTCHNTEAPLCLACKGASLQAHMYCLYCDRWGLDHLLTPHVNRRQPPRNARPTTPTPPGSRRDQAHPLLNRDRDRDRRKIRHALRMAAREKTARDRRSKDTIND
ncbi:MAG: hypothetical protein ABI353_03780 [Isosphaeraceae bacterium]